MRILAVVVAYRPDEEALRRCLDSFREGVDMILLWQNSPFSWEDERLERCGDGTNRGIAPALNYAWQYALREGYDYLLTMDQDSVWQDFPAFLQLAASAPAGLWGPWVNTEPPAAYEASDLLITSGMLVSVSLLNRIGGWRTDFKVDALDVDLVLHARELGIPAWHVGGGWLQQQFARRRSNGLFHVYDYPPERLYGIFRNHVIVIRRYAPVSGNLRKMFIRRWILSRPVRILLGEKGRWKKLGAMWRGLRDGLRWHGKRVSVVTWFGTPNYGTNLQAYATVWGLRQAGASPRLLHRFEIPSSLAAVRENLHRSLGIRRFWKYAPDPWPVKTKKIRAFCREQLPSCWVITPLGLRHLKDATDLFLCGGDQLWNARDHYRPFELLGFVSGVPKAAFGTSLGGVSIPEAYAADMRGRLADFGPLALREASGVRAVAALTGRNDIRQVADPVFLLSAEDWLQQAVPAPAREPYLLSYLLRPGQEESVKALSAAAGLSRIVSLPAGENPHPGVGEVQGTAGLREFIGLVAGASLVITDSFHGLALSAILSREMVLFKRFRDQDPASQNGRLDELAESLGLGDRYYAGALPAPVDWPAVQERIALARKRAQEILKEILS